jgi:murein DD-endopeptidase MepM/ murein hydrolase activator NlpD
MRPRCAVGAGILLLLPTYLPSHLPELSESVGEGAAAAEAIAVRTVTAAVEQPARVLRGTVGRRATLGTMLRDTLHPTGVHRLVEASRPVYDLARISVGHPFGVTFGPDGLLAAFTYGIDELRTLRVTRQGEEYRAEVVKREYDVTVASVRGEIKSSLFGAVTGAGEEDQLALDLADIFMWDVDFNTELQKGDSFRVAVEKLSLDGTFSRYGRILAAELVRGDRVLRAVRFEGRNGPGYFMPDGRPMRKAFLRSPLRFTRISSGFSHARLHPILGVVRPHFGVDFAAPVGTPVRASADGVVIAAGTDGGYGKVVRLRHANGYETLYGHLSRIDVRVGQRLEQSTVLGAVGMTGLATGPHLDYRMIRGGAYVNPLRMQSPPADPISADEEDAFQAVRDRQLALLGPAAAGLAVAQAGTAPAPVVAHTFSGASP